MPSTAGKRKHVSDQQILNSLHSQKMDGESKTDGELTLQILRIRRELMDLLQLLKGL